MARPFEPSSTANRRRSPVVPAGGEELREVCRYGHVKADHDAAGACVRPSLDARAAAAAAYPDPLRIAVRIAFERGWDAAVAALAPENARPE